VINFLLAVKTMSSMAFIIVQSRSQKQAAPERAEALLMKAEKDLQELGALDIKPNSICYSGVINCWAKSGRTDAPEAMLKLLLTMMLQYLAGDVSLRTNRDSFPARYCCFIFLSSFSAASEYNHLFCSDQCVCNGQPS
jgi:hypothetical protein